jgi:hypothetical protein
MVCIIDDREDVWNYARNLICVQPYVFFKNIGDINDPQFKSKGRKRKLNETSFDTQQQPQHAKTYPQALNKLETTNAEASALAKLPPPEIIADENDPQAGPLNNDNANPQNTVDNEMKEESRDGLTNEMTSDVQPPQQQQLASLTTINNSYDPDDYLVYLEEILRKIHDEYYKIYEQRVDSCTASANDVDDVNESNLPDVKKVLPMIKSRVLENCVITFSGVVPTGYDLKKQRCYLIAKSLGAKINEHLILADEDCALGASNNSSSNNNYDESELCEYKRRKYEYNFDDEDSDSNCSGSNYFFKSDDSSESSSEDSMNPTNGGVNFSLEPPADGVTTAKKKKKRFTTHLVAAKYGTIKVHDALRSKLPIKVVTPEWLINCNYKWKRCDENDFKLTKEYDYKNCIFHHEHNYH